MNLCPKCKAQLEADFEDCPNCGKDLSVDETEISKSVIENPVFFKSVSNEIEANILESLLNSYGIPVIKKYGELGTTLILYAGNTNYGVDLYVPESMLDKANDIANAETELSDEEIMTDYGNPLEDEKEISEFNESYKIVIVILIVVVILAILVPLFSIYLK